MAGQGLLCGEFVLEASDEAHEALPYGSMQLSEGQNACNSEAELELMKKELYDLQRKLLTAPRKDRKQRKFEVETLDSRINEVYRARNLLGKMSTRSRQHSKASNDSSQSEEIEKLELVAAQLPLNSDNSTTSRQPEPTSESSESLTEVPLFPLSRKTSLQELDSPVQRLDLAEIEVYESESSEDSGQVSQVDSEHEANFNYHQQLMGHTATNIDTACVTGTCVTACGFSEVEEDITMACTETCFANSDIPESRNSSQAKVNRRGSMAENDLALPGDLAYLQHFSFLEEMAMREEAALREELAIDDDDELPEELDDLKVDTLNKCYRHGSWRPRTPPVSELPHIGEHGDLELGESKTRIRASYTEGNSDSGTSVATKHREVSTPALFVNNVGHPDER